MDWDLLLNVASIGVVLFFDVIGALALVLPGRLDALQARALGLGRHVEALLVISLVTSVYFAIGLGNVPVWVDRNGVVAFSLTGALLPAILSAYFLVRAGWRGAAALAGVAAVARIAYLVSAPVEDLGIVATFPAFFLPSIAAALVGTLLAPGSLRAIPIAYACGSLGALIGADLVRFGWIIETRKAVAASLGGAEAQDLVFLAGLWAAAFAWFPLLPYWSRLRRASPAWEPVARLAAEGRMDAAVEEASQRAHEALDAWARTRSLAHLPRAELRRRSLAEPVLVQAEAARAYGALLPPEHAAALLERLESLTRRLQEPPELPTPAPARRLAAAAIDLLPALAIGVLAFALATGAPPASRAFFGLSAAIASHILVPFATEWILGATLGKALLGLRVRRRDGSRIGPWDAFVRNLARLLDIPLFYLIAFVAPPESGRQRLGDYFADTVVVDASATQTMVATTPAPTPDQATMPAARMSPTERWPGTEDSTLRKRARK